METPLMYQYDLRTGEYTSSRPAQLRPNGKPILESGGASPICPPEAREGYVICWRDKNWELVEDHRRKQDKQGRDIEGTGTPYWLPEDTWQSPARYRKELGPLPEDARLEKPQKPLSAVQEEKLRSIERAHASALAGAVALADPSPTAVAVESSLLAASDAEGLEWVRDKLYAWRGALEDAVRAAVTKDEVEAVVVSFPV